MAVNDRIRQARAYLFDAPLEIVKLGQVLVARCGLVAQHVIDLRLRALQGRGVQSEVVDRPREARGRGVVALELIAFSERRAVSATYHKSIDLVADLEVLQGPLRVLVDGGEQQVQEVEVARGLHPRTCGFGSLRAASFDDHIGQVVDHFERAAPPPTTCREIEHEIAQQYWTENVRVIS